MRRLIPTVLICGIALGLLSSCGKDASDSDVQMSDISLGGRAITREDLSDPALFNRTQAGEWFEELTIS